MYIEQPTKRIKILKPKTRKETINYRTIKTNTIDFYNLKDSESWENTDTGDVDIIKKPSNGLVPLSYLQKKFPKMEKVIKRSKNELDEQFLISNLKYDLRVRDFVETFSYIIVDFGNIHDSLSFHQQYSTYFNLSFVVSCDWGIPEEKNDAYFLLSNVKNIKKPNKIEIYKNVIDDLAVPSYTRDEFITRVEYFNQLKQCFTRTDINGMNDSLARGDVEFIFNNTKELAVGSKSNKIVQDAIKIMSGDEIEKLINSLEYDIVPISATKHGAYTVQALLAHSTNKVHKKLVIQYFSKNSGYLITHEIGNYTFQKLLIFDYDLVYRMFIENFIEFSNNELGLKVFKRCVEYFKENKNELETNIEEYSENISVENLNTLRSIVKTL